MDTPSDKFLQITQKFATLYLFYPFLSCFFCTKFLFKNYIVRVIFSNQYFIPSNFFTSEGPPANADVTNSQECSDRDETINHIISECSKLTQKEYKARYNPAPVLENNMHKPLWDLDIQTDHLISVRIPDLIIINKKEKKKVCKIVDFAVLTDNRIKLKEFEKRDKNHDLAREWKKLWNIKVTIITIVIGAFGTITKGLLKGMEDLEVGGRVETIQTTALLKTARILRRVLETWGDLLSLNLLWKTISLRWREKL